MVTKQFTLEVRTPLMIGSQTEQVDTKPERIRQRDGTFANVNFKIFLKRAEIKPNSFKGILRWWFRSLHGFSENLSKHFESPLFGSTDTSCPYKMKVFPNKVETGIFDTRLKDEPIGTYRFSGKTGVYDGLSYFGYNLFNKSKKRGKEKISKTEYFKPGSQFDIKIIAKNEDTLSKVLLIFWLALQFGGFGARSRRCFGNLKIITEFTFDLNEKTFSFKNSYSSTEDYDKTLEGNFEVIKKVFSIDLKLDLKKSKIPTLHGSKLFLSKVVEGSQDARFSTVSQMAEALKQTKLALVGNSGPNWKKAVGFAGATMQMFRALRENDHNNVRIFKRLDEIERAVFGLPLQFRFSMGGLNPVNINHYKKDEGQRLGSPVVVSTTEISNHFHVQYLILHFDYDSLNIKARQNNGLRSLRIKNILSDFFGFLLNPKISDIQGSLNSSVKIEKFKYTDKTRQITGK